MASKVPPPSPSAPSEADEAAALALQPTKNAYKRFFGPDLYVRVTPASQRYPRGVRSIYGRWWLDESAGQGEAKLVEQSVSFGALGSLKDGKTLTLASAHEALLLIQADAAAHLDPRIERKRRKGAEGNRFAALVADWITWRARKAAAHRNDQVASMFERHVLPDLGKMRLESISNGDVLRVLHKIEASGAPSVAVECCAYIRAAFEYARTVDRFDSINPVSEDTLDHLENPEPVHHAAVQREDLPQFFADLNRHGWYDPMTPLGLRLMLHVFPRSATLRFMRWDWINWDAAVILVPENAEGLKQRTRHRRNYARAKQTPPKGPFRIPMSRQVVAILRALGADRHPEEWFVFPHRSKNEPVSSGTWLGALKDLGWDGALPEDHKDYRPNATVHGFRATFMTACVQEFGSEAEKLGKVERLDWMRGAQRQLDHVDADPVQAAYERDKLGGHRGLYLEQRRAIMQWWSDALEEAETGKKVAKPKNHKTKRGTGFRVFQKRRMKVERTRAVVR